MVQPPYFLDRSLPQRVEKYIKENVEIDIDEMTDYLIKNYRDFSQKKRNMFIKSVQKAYDYNMSLRGNKSSEEEILEIPRTTPNSNSSYAPARYASFKTPPGKQNKGSDKELEIIAKEDIITENLQTSSKTIPTKGSIRNSDDPQIITDLNNGKMDETPKTTPSTGAKKRLLTSDGTMQGRRIKRVKRHFTLEKPSSNFDELEGVDDLENILWVLLCSLVRPRTEFVLPKTALVTGPPGSGKSSFINALAECVNASLLHVTATDFVEGISGDSEEKVKEAFEMALSSGPCILHLDKLDVLTQRDSSSAKGLEKRICSKISSCIEDVKGANKDKQILILAETSYPERIDLDLKVAFEEEIFMPPFDEPTRIKVLQSLTRHFAKEMDFSLIAKHTTSFVAGDLKSLVIKSQRAAMIAFKGSIQKKSEGQSRLKEKLVPKLAKYCSLSKEELPEVNLEHFLDAVPEVTPVLKREGFPSVPEITWDDIGGLEDIKKELKEKIIDPIVYPDLHRKFNATRSNGILLWGPPGCGKTLLAKAVANQAGINFYPVNGPEILNKFQGESERAIRDIFQRASKVAPCVIFFDEFDSICPNRNKSSFDSGSKGTIVNTLLAELEGTRRRDNVHVLAATNRPDILDPAVTRPGRFDTLIYVDIPDLKGRESVFKACTKGGTLPKLTSDVDLLEIAKNCSNFTGADCSQLVYIASKLAIRELIESLQSNSTGVLAVSLRHFEEALKIVQPSVSQKERRHYAVLQSKQGQSRLLLRKGGDCPVFEVEDDSSECSRKPDENCSNLSSPTK